MTIYFPSLVAIFSLFPRLYACQQDVINSGGRKITSMYIASFSIPLCVFIMDCLALNTRKYDVHEEFKNWSITNGTGIPPDELYSSAKAFLMVDIVIFLVSLVTLMIIGVCCCCWRSASPTYCNTMILWYLLTFPAANFATHFNQIALGFIHTYEHAVTVALLYVMPITLLLHIHC